MLPFGVGPRTRQGGRAGVFEGRGSRWLYGFCLVMAGSAVYAVKILTFPAHGHDRLNRYMEWILLHALSHPPSHGG
jgi:hypothetical protein